MHHVHVMNNDFQKCHSFTGSYRKNTKLSKNCCAAVVAMLAMLNFQNVSVPLGHRKKTHHLSILVTAFGHKLTTQKTSNNNTHAKKMTMNTAQVRRAVLLMIALWGVAQETSFFGSPRLFLTAAALSRALSSSDSEGAIDISLDRLLPHSTSRGPNQDATICACAKCGSTSLHDGLHQMITNEPWTHKDAPWLQQAGSSRWKHAFNTTKPSSTEELVNCSHEPSTFACAVIRDPQELLISPWKSKITCSTAWQTDTHERNFFVTKLLTLAKSPALDHQKKWCLTLTEFLRALVKVHQDGNASLLDRHFLPQTENCFKHVSPTEWDVVTTVGAPMASKKLWNGLQMTPPSQTELPIPQDFGVQHATGQSDFQLSPKQEEMLKCLTEQECQVLGDFLPPKKKNDPNLQAAKESKDDDGDNNGMMKDTHIVDNASKQE